VRVSQRIAAVEAGADQPGQEVGDTGSVDAAAVVSQQVTLRLPLARALEFLGAVEDEVETKVKSVSGSRAQTA